MCVARSDHHRRCLYNATFCLALSIDFLFLTFVPRRMDQPVRRTQQPPIFYPLPLQRSSGVLVWVIFGLSHLHVSHVRLTYVQVPGCDQSMGSARFPQRVPYIPRKSPALFCCFVLSRMPLLTLLMLPIFLRSIKCKRTNPWELLQSLRPWLD